MTDHPKNQRDTICRTCGRPLKAGFFQFTLNPTVKLILVFLLLSYISLSILFLALSTPPELRRGCGPLGYRISLNPIYKRDPERCQPDDVYLALKPLSKMPVVQVLVAGGLLAGVLLFYWDWAQTLVANWRKKRAEADQKEGKPKPHKCRTCGRTWD
jgi:hypothetical protein